MFPLITENIQLFVSFDTERQMETFCDNDEREILLLIRIFNLSS